MDRYMAGPHFAPRTTVAPEVLRRFLAGTAGIEGRPGMEEFCDINARKDQP
jgi:hypothetical protein